MDEPLKIFVSLPMNGRSDEDILNAQYDIFRRWTAKHVNPKRQTLLLDSILQGEPKPGVKNERLWYLGGSIRIMSMADVVIFARDWRDAYGCRIEHAICELYKINHTYDELENRDDIVKQDL